MAPVRTRAPSHVLVLAIARRPANASQLGRSRRQRKALPEPEPTPVTTSRATIVDVGDPVSGRRGGRAWLKGAGEAELAAGLAVLNRALHAHRIASADPRAHGVGRHDALVARLGYGAGEQVADGLWTDARELIDAGPAPAAARPRRPGASRRPPHRPPRRARVRGAHAPRPARPRRRPRPRGRASGPRRARRRARRAPGESRRSRAGGPARRAARPARRRRRRGAHGARSARSARPSARRWRSHSAGSRRRSGLGRRRFRDSAAPVSGHGTSQTKCGQDGVELVHHVAAHPHRGAAVQRRRALGQDRDPAARRQASSQAAAPPGRPRARSRCTASGRRRRPVPRPA